MPPGPLMYRPTALRQHGHGFGSFLSSFFRTLLPVAKKYVLPHVVEGARNVASDIMNGKSFKESMKENATGVLKGVAGQVFSQRGNGSRRGQKRKRGMSNQLGEGFKRRKVRKTKSKKPRKSGNKKSRKAKKYTSKKKNSLKKSDFVTLFD